MRTVWTSVQRGYGTVDDAGLWHATWGLWHLVTLPDRSFLPGSEAVCGSDVYRRSSRDVRRDWDSDVPDGKVCRKCLKIKQGGRPAPAETA